MIGALDTPVHTDVNGLKHLPLTGLPEKEFYLTERIRPTQNVRHPVPLY
jgi:hypothetical protein